MKKKKPRVNPICDDLSEDIKLTLEQWKALHKWYEEIPMLKKAQTNFNFFHYRIKDKKK